MINGILCDIYISTLCKIKTNHFCFEQCAVTVKALGLLHCVEVVFSFGIDRSFSFSPKCEKHCNQCLFLVRHACWWQLLWALPTHMSFTVTISPTVLLFCLFCHIAHPQPCLFSSLCPFTPNFMHTHYICLNSFQVSTIWCSDILSTKLTSVQRDCTAEILQAKEFILAN